MPLSLCPFLQGQGIENGARLTVRVWQGDPIRTREQVEALVDEMVACNPGADRMVLLRRAYFGNEGLLLDW